MIQYELHFTLWYCTAGVAEHSKQCSIGSRYAWVRVMLQGIDIMQKTATDSNPVGHM